jgi:signal transduction histidine kinase
MKLTKQLEAEVLETYQASWNALFRGDIKTFASLLDDQVVIYGSAAGEIFTTKKAAVKFYTATADQITGKVDLRKRKIGLQVVNHTVVVHELCELFFLTEQGWVFYGPARITDILEKKGKTWKIIHHHTSFPDSRTIEGEQFATEKIKAENLLLRDAVQRRTVELEHKNRKLEMEAALEKVRSVAMGMKQADDMLSICQTISTELQKLGIKEIRNVQTAIIHQEKGTYTNYEFYTKHNKHLRTEVSYTNHAMSKAFIKKMLDGPNEFFKRSLKGKKVQEWYSFQKKSTNQFADTYLAKASSLNYYWYSLGPVALGVSTYAPLKKEEEELVVRFKNVFELAYRRYLDIEKASAQAREAQIEAALERIRAASLAMQDSSALSEIIFKLYGELTKLDAKLDRCFIMIVHPENKGITWWMAGQEGLLAENGFFVQMNQHPSHLMYLDYCKKRKKKWTYLFEGKEKRDWDRFGFSKTELIKLPEPIKVFMAAAKKVHLSGSSDQFGSLVTGSFEPLPEEQQEIISRFAIAFNQAYIRFLDLQKAEAQARESQIEAAVERVRAQSMAMHLTNDLHKVTEELLHQLEKLSIDGLTGTTIYLVDEHDIVEAWDLSSPGNIGTPGSYTVTYDAKKYPVLGGWVNEWRTSDQNYFSLEFPKEALLKAVEEWKEVHPEIAQMFESAVVSGKLTHQWSPAGRLSKGILAVDLTNPPTEDTKNIVIKMSGAFNLAYQRFEDLQKAEAQAREAQIEAALERVRSRSMAMHKSEELKDVIKVVLEQFIHLNINAEHAGFYIDYKEHDDMHIWLADPNIEPFYATLPYFDTPTWNSFLEAKAKGTVLHTDLLDFKTKNKFYKSLFKIFTVPEEAQQFYLQCKGLAVSTVLLDTVGLYIENFSAIPYTDEENKILIRFGKVFQQTYTRFLDLQKAEEQAKEAQVEAALERVRSRSLAMHHTSELQDVVDIVAQQLHNIGMDINGGVFISINDEVDEMLPIWASSGAADYIQRVVVPYLNRPIFIHLRDAIKKRNNFFEETYSKKEKDEMFRHLFNYPPWSTTSAERKKELLFRKGGLTRLATISQQTSIAVTNHNGKQFSEEEKEILKRFGTVFEQAYTRFLDLQKAEEQAREAQIELSLERVRAKTMAMHNSADVGDTAAAMVEELKKLGVETLRCGIGIMHEPGDMEVWTISTDENKKTDIIIGWLDMHMHPLLHGGFESWRAQVESFSYNLEGEDLLNYYNAINNYPGYPIRYDTSGLPSLIHHNEFHFTEGTLFSFSLQQLTDEQRKIFKRFASVFGQTYRRYLDLQKAEAQAREAQIEAALEKVRSRTLAMQKSDELAGTAAVLFQQLISLSIEPNRLYIILIREDTEDMEAWVTDEDGSKVSMGFTGNYRKNISLFKMYEGWKEKRKRLVIDMQGEELQQYFQYLHDELNVPFKGGLEQKRRVQHIAYFSHGLIGMASPDEQPAETLQLLERFAAVFNLTFTRFNDLQIAEAHALQAEQDLIAIKEAKQKAEEALTELQATQKQLIQSEKMASLGELTAGIAHEIQNPLNFVNNFSEVSGELLKELVDEVDKGNTDEAKLIADDLIGNLEKINHHGKRAADIVKGMLQHSRSSSGVKELTDINALCDEYLRLAYHGLRAKDKSFSAKFETSFDENVGKINIMPQEIGRVVLNLINNAFYAVNERKKLNEPAYEPTVTVTTQKEGDKMKLTVADNGTGIPKKALDKIFQPFFTTKPSGQGTGLGLSLSYDIVKAHGGELKVETKEREGTTFMIQLQNS